MQIRTDIAAAPSGAAHPTPSPLVPFLRSSGNSRRFPEDPTPTPPGLEPDPPAWVEDEEEEIQEIERPRTPGVRITWPQRTTWRRCSSIVEKYLKEAGIL